MAFEKSVLYLEGVNAWATEKFAAEEETRGSE